MALPRVRRSSPVPNAITRIDGKRITVLLLGFSFQQYDLPITWNVVDNQEFPPKLRNFGHSLIIHGLRTVVAATVSSPE
jgi:hypothetical protein